MVSGQNGDGRPRYNETRTANHVLPTIRRPNSLPDGLRPAKGQHGSGALVKSDSGNGGMMSFDLKNPHLR